MLFLLLRDFTSDFDHGHRLGAGRCPSRPYEAARRTVRFVRDGAWQHDHAVSHPVADGPALLSATFRAPCMNGLHFQALLPFNLRMTSLSIAKFCNGALRCVMHYVVKPQERPGDLPRESFRSSCVLTVLLFAALMALQPLLSMAPSPREASCPTCP